MAIPRQGKPYIWATWLSGVLSGAQPCVWQSAFKSRFKYGKIPDPTFDAAAWAATHADFVRARADELSMERWQCRVEDENAFRIDGREAILAGKPDIVAYRPGEIRISDIKTGKKQDSHWWQVLVYLQAWPLWVPDQCESPVVLSGEIAYPDQIIDIAPQELTPARAAETWRMITTLAHYEGLAPMPTELGCRYCDIPSTECPSRWDPATAKAQVSTKKF
jgi:hypothetical protein